MNQTILCDRLGYGQGKENTILLQERLCFPFHSLAFSLNNDKDLARKRIQQVLQSSIEAPSTNFALLSIIVRKDKRN